MRPSPSASSTFDSLTSAILDAVYDNELWSIDLCFLSNGGNNADGGTHGQTLREVQNEAEAATQRLNTAGGPRKETTMAERMKTQVFYEGEKDEEGHRRCHPWDAGSQGYNARQLRRDLRTSN